MHFPSLVLSAAALLARGTSGYYLLKSTHDALSEYGFAKIRFGPDDAVGGFYHGEGNPYADIRLSNIQDGAMTSFVLRKVDDGVWSLMSRLGISAKPDDITGPFEIDADTRFVYKGEGGGVWNVCESMTNYDLLLSVKPIEIQGCIGNVTLEATWVDY
ncbi:hypothetical protein C8A01DRAFT_38548 [Parachaetomium inaequale]|uniref:Uncharacterized protein n=1 Tax=Parachaetomium inaequale TaxID=2588326 RepID=A0AAN6SPI7_9PEZI|nr:hypothetical protein C8A01DRAFT_38548 [Parachaetomium inaequale]